MKYKITANHGHTVYKLYYRKSFLGIKYWGHIVTADNEAKINTIKRDHTAYVSKPAYTRYEGADDV